MVEGDDEQEVNALAQHLADSVRSQAHELNLLNAELKHSLLAHHHLRP
jgi:hypothetical protein